MSSQLINRTIEASEKWKSYFNKGDAAGCASMYEPGATMVAKPFGTFVGRDEIQAFWQNLIDQGFADVTYVEPSIREEGERHTVLSSGWTMNNARGVITKELWAMQEDGTMLLVEDHFEAQS